MQRQDSENIDFDYDYENQSDHQLQSNVKYLVQNEVYEILQKEIDELSQFIPDFNYDQILEVFKYFNWSQTKFLSEYFQSEEVQAKYNQIFQSNGILPNQSLKQCDYKYCLICFEEFNEQNQQFSIQCGHSFCENCWINNLRQKVINEQSIDLHCMFNQCEQVQFFSFIEKITKKYPELSTKYQQLLCKKYIRESKNMGWCPGTGCIYCIQVSDSNQKQLKCICGQEFCFKCKTEIHFPAPCDLVKRWLNDVIKTEANEKWIMINTKMCPFCSAFVERSLGCNFLKCTCGNAFCYVCCQPWEPIHNNHFKCSAYDSRQEIIDRINKNKQEEILNKYNFHVNRFLNADGTKKKTEEYQKIISETLESAFNYLQQTYNDCQFITEALNELKHFRQILKWTYCFAFYSFNQPEDQTQQQVFLHNLEQFEMICDHLSIQIMNIFDYIQLIARTKVIYEIRAYFLNLIRQRVNLLKKLNSSFHQ